MKHLVLSLAASLQCYCNSSSIDPLSMHLGSKAWAEDEAGYHRALAAYVHTRFQNNPEARKLGNQLCKLLAYSAEFYVYFIV